MKLKKKPKKRLFRRFIIRCLGAVTSLMITVIIALGLFYIFIQIQLPDVSVLKDVHMQVPLQIYTSEGKLIAEYGAKRRIPISLAQVPNMMIKAVLATEDARFYSHPGIDFVGLLRAGSAVIHSGRKVQGASTITMQVARNFFLNPEKTYSRKFKEILLALKIDREFSKDKILELYLNKVYFGQRAYGVAAASQAYFGKTLDKLTLPEIALIAGMPQAPSRDNPLTNPTGALKRRNHVLQRMLEVEFINQKQYQESIVAPITASFHVTPVEVQAPYIAEMVRSEMFAKYGEAAYDDGFQVYTTITTPLQTNADKSLQDGLIAYAERHGYQKSTLQITRSMLADHAKAQNLLKEMRTNGGLQAAAVIGLQDHSAQILLANGAVEILPWSGLAWARPALSNGFTGASPQTARDVLKVGDVIWVRKQADGQWRLSQMPTAQGAMVVLNPQTGAILALAGGFDYRNSNFNRAIQAERQPGSNFKPFIYSAALEKGYTLASLINDAPIVIPQSGKNSIWRPLNDEMKFYGPTRLRVGLAKSRNMVTIRLLQSTGISFAVNFAARFGFDESKLPKALSLALGSGVVTPLQIATGYSVFANGGYRITPYFIQYVADQDNQPVFKANHPKACQVCVLNGITAENNAKIAPQAISSQNAYLITQALKDVVRNGTGAAASVLQRGDIAGKTGTTNQQVDAWFSGFNSNIEATVWIGFDNLRPLQEYGSQAALPIWVQFMRQALQGMPEASMPQPPGIVTIRIDPHTGMMASPDQQDAIMEVFDKNNAPHEFASSEPSIDSPAKSGQRDSDQDQPLF